MISSVDTSALLELVWAAPLAALTVTIAWGMVVYGSARAADARREGRMAIAALSIAVAIVGTALFSAALVLGFIVMTSKA